MNGREFITVAIQLRTTNTDAAQRTRVGRAYYAAFLEARQFTLEYLGMSTNRSIASHGAVALMLASIDPQFQIDLTQLRNMRNVANYDLDLPTPFLATQADQACILAGSIIRRLDSLKTLSRKFGGMPVSDPEFEGALSRESDYPSIEALENLLPAEQSERDSISLMLLSYPGLPDMILRAIEIIHELFPGTRLFMDTVAYDVWDPPLRLLYQYSPDAGGIFEQHNRILQRIRADGTIDTGLVSVEFTWTADSDVEHGASEDE